MLSAADQQLADSILTVGLDNEALYTLLDTLKPISSVVSFRIGAMQKDSLLPKEAGVIELSPSDIVRLERFQRVVNTLRFGDVRLVMVPYKDIYDGQRYVEIFAIRESVLRSVVRRDSLFWYRRGFTSEASVDLLLAANEYDNRYDRWRGYGYLFGYPRHAVDFFVQSGRTFDSTKVFVPRDFFQIPAYSAQQGRFVYAVPKGYVPTDLDSTLYHAASATLTRYRSIRPHYMNADSSVRAIDLITDETSRAESK
jgi:hypothetical protein